jgi:hypothetical protein
MHYSEFAIAPRFPLAPGIRAVAATRVLEDIEKN